MFSFTNLKSDESNLALVENFSTSNITQPLSNLIIEHNNNNKGDLSMNESECKIHAGTNLSNSKISGNTPRGCYKTGTGSGTEFYYSDIADMTGVIATNTGNFCNSSNSEVQCIRKSGSNTKYVETQTSTGDKSLTPEECQAYASSKGYTWYGNPNTWTERPEGCILHSSAANGNRVFYNKSDDSDITENKNCGQGDFKCIKKLNYQEYTSGKPDSNIDKNKCKDYSANKWGAESFTHNERPSGCFKHTTSGKYYFNETEIVQKNSGDPNNSMSEDECKAYGEGISKWGGSVSLNGEIKGCYKVTTDGKIYYNTDMSSTAKCDLGSRSCIQKTPNCSSEYPCVKNIIYEERNCGGSVGGDKDCKVDGSWDQVTVPGWDNPNKNLEEAKKFCNDNDSCVGIAQSSTDYNWPITKTDLFKPCNTGDNCNPKIKYFNKKTNSSIATTAITYIEKNNGENCGHLRINTLGECKKAAAFLGKTNTDWVGGANNSGNIYGCFEEGGSVRFNKNPSGKFTHNNMKPICRVEAQGQAQGQGQATETAPAPAPAPAPGPGTTPAPSPESIKPKIDKCACMDSWSYKGKNYNKCTETTDTIEEYHWCNTKGLCDNGGKNLNTKSSWKKCTPDNKIDYSDYEPKDDNEKKESNVYKKCMIKFIDDNLGPKFSDWKDIFDEKKNNPILKKKGLYDKSKLCRKKASNYMINNDLESNCNFCRIDWLKNNDKIEEDLNFSYICLSNNDYTLTPKYGKYFKCKYPNYNNDKSFYANIMKYEDSINTEYICVHPDVINRFSKDNDHKCSDDNKLIKFKKVDQTIDESDLPENNENNEDTVEEVSITAPSPSEVVKPEGLLVKLYKNKTMFFTIVGILSLFIIYIIISLF